MKHVIIWEGPGWYADLGRVDSEGKSYIEGRRVATYWEYDPDGFALNDGEPIWNRRFERGTPYRLGCRPAKTDEMEVQDIYQPGPVRPRRRQDNDKTEYLPQRQDKD